VCLSLAGDTTGQSGDDRQDTWNMTHRSGSKVRAARTKSSDYIDIYLIYDQTILGSIIFS